MVLQYRLKNKAARWQDYPGKAKFKGDVKNFDFRLLTHDKSAILVKKGTYEFVLKRMRQIEFFKHR